MSRQFWSETIAWATANGGAIPNTTTESILFPNVTLPANFMQDGRSIRLRAWGSISNVVTAQPTITFALRWGGVAGTVLATSGALTCSASAFTGAIFDIELMVTTRSNGSSGSLMAIGTVNIGNDADPQARGMGSAGALVPAAVSSLDLTSDTALSLTAKWGTANASNTITGMNFYVESLN